MYKKNSFIQRSYLLYRIGEDLFASDSNRVRNIFGAAYLVDRNRANGVKRFLSFRGKDIPVIDPRRQVGLKAAERSENNWLIILEPFQAPNKKIALIVDEVKELLEIDDMDLIENTGIGEKYKPGFIDKIVKVNNEDVRIINLEKIIKTDTEAAVNKLNTKVGLVV